MFSYAQAAKGLAPSTQNTTSLTNSASPELSSKDAVSTTETGLIQAKSKVVASVTDLSPDSQLPNGQPHTEKAEDEDRRKTIAQTSPPNTEIRERITSADLSSQANSGKEDLSSPTPQSVTESDATGNISKSEQPMQPEDADKSKDIDDDWEKVSVPSVSAEKELKAAPLPVVNIWQQRKEAQEAKVKEQVGQRPAVAATTTVPKQRSQVAPTKDDSKRKQAVRDSTAEKEASGQRRNNSGIRPNTSERKERSPPQHSPRSLSKQGDKSGSAPPPAGDAESWPTPESAVVDERRRSATQEKPEKTDAKANSQKKWVQMPFVPSAKFVTPLPPAATARRGGRASNRGRDSANRGGHNTSSTSNNENNEVGSMGPPPIPKQVAEQDRGRKGDAPRNQRASSVPTQSRRSESNDGNANNSRKGPAVPQRGQAEGSKTQPDLTRPTNSLADENNGMESSRSPSQQPGFVPASNRRYDASTLPNGSDVAQAGLEDIPRDSTHTESNRASSRDNHRSSNDVTDRTLISGREWSRGRPDVSREKVDTWRDNRREPRPERGRGGYRGRGNHSNYNGHSQPFTAPLVQTEFGFPKSYSGEGKGRQTSQPFAQSQAGSNGRNYSRSQSGPASGVQPSYYTAPQPFASQTMSPISPDGNYVNYPGQMPSGIMNAMPYADQLNSMALFSMVVTQLEYYFSINNLCKDLFLRKNMDSQGFVPLSVIAGFKRIRALTDGQMSHEQFRSVCQQSSHVEFVTTEDGNDKLRARINWRDFILPVEERVPSAQNEGPNLRPYERHYSNQIPHNFVSPGVASRSPVAMNGFSEPFTPSTQTAPYPPPPPFDGATTDGHPQNDEGQPDGEARRSSTTSPFDQVQSPTLQDTGRSASHLTNGHHRSGSFAPGSENVFPDEKIPELKVVVRDPAYDPSQAQGANSVDSKTSKLRGGAGSPQQLDRLKNIQFGQTSPDTEEDQTPFWTKHGHIAKVPEGPSFIHEDYLSLRDQALTQRDNKHFDGALAVLYPFWSTFLVENFNLSMYQEFASFATDEAATGGQNGQTYLFSFYDTLLKRRMPVSERMAVEVVTMFNREREQSDKGPLFEVLRNALRNGATDFKTVKRIMSLLKPEEKADLGV